MKYWFISCVAACWMPPASCARMLVPPLMSPISPPATPLAPIVAVPPFVNKTLMPRWPAVEVPPVTLVMPAMAMVATLPVAVAPMPSAVPNTAPIEVFAAVPPMVTLAEADAMMPANVGVGAAHRLGVGDCKAVAVDRDAGIDGRRDHAAGVE